MITEVVDTGLRLALDPLFPPPNFAKRISQQIPLTPWELCYDSTLDDKEMDELYSRYEAKEQKNETVKEDEFDEELLKEEVEEIFT